MAPVLDRIDHVHLYVADREASERWYESVLGFTRIPELAFWSPDGGPLTVGNPSGTVHIALFERPAEKCRSTVAFGASATEFLAWITHLQKVLDRPMQAVDHEVSWSLYFSDPDANPFEITSYEYAALASQLRR